MKPLILEYISNYSSPSRFLLKISSQMNCEAEHFNFSFSLSYVFHHDLALLSSYIFSSIWLQLKICFFRVSFFWLRTREWPNSDLSSDFNFLQKHVHTSGFKQNHYFDFDFSFANLFWGRINHEKFSFILWELDLLLRRRKLHTSRQTESHSEEQTDCRISNRFDW